MTMHAAHMNDIYVTALSHFAPCNERACKVMFLPLPGRAIKTNFTYQFVFELWEKMGLQWEHAKKSKNNRPLSPEGTEQKTLACKLSIHC